MYTHTMGHTCSSHRAVDNTEDPYLTILKRFLHLLESPMITHALRVRDYLRSTDTLLLPKDADLLKDYTALVEKLTAIHTSFVGKPIAPNKPSLLSPNGLQALTEAEQTCKHALYTLRASQDHLNVLVTSSDALDLESIKVGLQETAACTEAYIKTLESMHPVIFGFGSGT
jgi:hypothetical protein